jgi:hypothetical protein
MVENEKPANSEDDRFERMFNESKKLAALIDVPDNTILEIYKAQSDWEFILKIDALLEAAVRKVVKTNLVGTARMNKGAIEKFIDTLPMRGRTSLLELLKGCGCAESEIALIDCVRRLRNGFAHDIVQVKLSLIDVIKKRNDKSTLIKGLSYIQNYDEADLIKMYEKDGSVLRFGIVHGTLIFLILAYHGAIKDYLPTSAK